MGLAKFLDALERLAAWMLVGIAVVFGVDVVCRYLFGFTAAFFPDVEWYGVCVAICISFGPALARGAHVGVELLSERFTTSLRRGIWVGGHLLLLLPWVAFVIYAGGRYAFNSWSIGEGSADPGGLPWRWLPKVAVVGGFALLGVVALAQILGRALPSHAFGAAEE